MFFAGSGQVNLKALIGGGVQLEKSQSLLPPLGVSIYQMLSGFL
jgi:hypothetical protein